MTKYIKILTIVIMSSNNVLFKCKIIEEKNLNSMTSCPVIGQGMFNCLMVGKCMSDCQMLWQCIFNCPMVWQYVSNCPMVGQWMSNCLMIGQCIFNCLTVGQRISNCPIQLDSICPVGATSFSSCDVNINYRYMWTSNTGILFSQLKVQVYHFHDCDVNIKYRYTFWKLWCQHQV